MSGDRIAVAAAVSAAAGAGSPSGPTGTLWPRPTIDRPSPEVGQEPVECQAHDDPPVTVSLYVLTV